MSQAVTKRILSGKGRLVVLSFLMLFVELALIRWTGSNVIYLSYFSNFILLGSFLGIGIGFLRGRSRYDLFPWAAVMLVSFALFVLWFPITIDRSNKDLIFFGNGTSGLPMWLVLPIVFLAVAAIMAAIAQEVSRSFAEFEPLEAYRLDIVGSAAGIIVFSTLSFLGSPPIVWGAIVSIAMIALYAGALRLLQVAALGVLIVALGKESAMPFFSWSPYYKISLFKIENGIQIDANNIPHQYIAAMRVYDPKQSIYFFPYRFKVSKPLDRVLIVGAGNGVDAAFALAHGAKRVDAVEIDPRIYQIGSALNPDHPYQDSRVHIHIDDGRAFLQRDTGRYDLIVFALPDSLTLVSGQSSLRLESYLFTSESFAAARAHLTGNGVFAMYNYYRETWLVDRLARTLNRVFGHPPCVWRQPFVRTAVLAVGVIPAGTSCKGLLWDPQAQQAPDPVTDDRPFLYLKTPSIPEFYLVTLALIALVSLAAVRLSAGPFPRMLPYTDLFFMGAAFMLLEAKSVVQFALLFGSTWFVNAGVFFGVLVAVYAAIETAKRFTLRRPSVVYVALFGWLAVAWAVEPSYLLALEAPLRLAAAIALSFGPIFLANVIFADRFRSSAASTVAFGTNLLGAMLGGILEYASLIVGYRNLLVVVALLYALAFALTSRQSEPAQDPSWAES